MGDTKVICTASVEDSVPRWLQGRRRGWVTAEYGMLPRSTDERMQRESTKGRPSGRTQEIQRLIGRSLRAVIDLKALGERTIWVDCDVLRADGGTRTASITGAYVALACACERLEERGLLDAAPLIEEVAAVSIGVVGGEVCLDLNYAEDSVADVDMNLVMTASGGLVEVQGTAENGVFERSALDRMLELGATGIKSLVSEQQKALAAYQA